MINFKDNIIQTIIDKLSNLVSKDINIEDNKYDYIKNIKDNNSINLNTTIEETHNKINGIDNRNVNYMYYFGMGLSLIIIIYLGVVYHLTIIS